MNKKMLGGIIVLIALVGIAGVFLLIGQKTDTESKKVYKAPSEEVLQKIRDDLAARKALEAAKPPPPGASPNGHWHDGEWHDGEHETQPVLSTDTEDLDSLIDGEEIKKVLRIYRNAGLDFNYTSPLTPEEQVEYDRLKISLPSEGIQVSHTRLKLTAKMLVFNGRLWDLIKSRKAGNITSEEYEKQRDELYRRYLI